VERKMKALRILFLVFILAQLTLIVDESQSNAAVSHGEKLRVAVTDDPPYTMKTEDGRWTGFTVDLWLQVARELKWDYELVEMSFEDIIRALHEGAVDLSIACLFQTPEREKLFEFSTSLGSTRLALAAPSERMEHPWLSALRIFVSWSTLKVIGIVISILFVIGSIFWLIEREKNPEHFGGGFFKGITSGVYWVGSTLTSGVCFGIDLKSLPGKIMGLFWMFFCAVVLSAFIASLTSSLTLSKLTTTVIDLNSLKSMHLGTVKGTVPATLLQRMNMRFTIFAEEHDVWEALANKRVDGFLYDEATLKYYASTPHGSSVSVYPIQMKRLQYAFSMPNGSPIRKEINAALLSLMNEPYWDFLADHYGFSENDNQQPAWGRRPSR
jgi:polar amino acid transport system substrate-binding protein